MSELVGDRSSLAFEFELREDPDAGGDPAVRASWGGLRIWVSGRNLTRARSAGGEIYDEAEVPLLPIVKWLVSRWDGLLHEGRLPRPWHTASSAGWQRDSVYRRLPTAPEALDGLLSDREAWWHRHGLGSALPDFMIPDLHFRRLGGEVEISWDDHEWKTVPGGIQLVEQPGVAQLPVGLVADTLHSLCAGVVAALRDRPAAAEVAKALQEELNGLSAPGRQQRRLRLAAGVDLERIARRLRELAGVVGGNIDDTIQALLGGNGAPAAGLYALLPAPVLLYRSAAPSLSSGDLTKLLGLANDAAKLPPPAALLEMRQPARPQGSFEAITDDGLERALGFRDDREIPLDKPLLGEFDLETGIIAELGIRVEDVHLDDPGVDGAAVLQPGAGAIIAINRTGKFARTRWGRRMTLAHELCHLLFDGDEGLMGIVSNRWAPYPLERRANAFAAMLLMPEPAVEACLSRDSETWSRDSLRTAMEALGVGVTTLTWHLTNLEWITESERQAWLEDLSAS